ncbi:uncharacterized [Tachysurus ichikawai]
MRGEEMRGEEMRGDEMRGEERSVYSTCFKTKFPSKQIRKRKTANVSGGYDERTRVRLVIVGLALCCSDCADLVVRHESASCQ